MKHIAIFCDGTWQHLDQRYPTNVAVLARAVTPDAAGGTPQFVYYDDGVGVGQGVADAVTQLFGGAFGEGLDYKITRAYEFVCLNYEPGDRIFIFGFSRGAYTARSLAGLLRWAWILRRSEASHVFDAMQLYRGHPTAAAPQADQDAFAARMQAFRAAHCYPDEPFVGEHAFDPRSAASLTPEGQRCAWLQYVGVWDTVGSLGIPSGLPLATQIDAKYQFFDTNLSRFVRSARHAVSIDEKRSTFSPTLFNNVDALNVNAKADQLPYVARPYQQQWFPGGHGDVGGGGDDGGISLAPMLWVAEGAARAGLGFDAAQLAAYANGAHPDAPFPPTPFSPTEELIKMVGTKPRQGPDVLDEVSLSARLRWRRVAGYRPVPLKRAAGLEPALDSWPAPADPQAYFKP